MPTYNYGGAGSSSDWLQFLQGLNGGGTNAWTDYLTNTPQWAVEQFDTDPSKGYAAYSALSGQGQSEGYQNWLKNQYSKYYGQYLNMAAQNPTYWWIDYLSNLNPQKDFALTASPQARGESPSDVYGHAPTMRMVW